MTRTQGNSFSILRAYSPVPQATTITSAPKCSACSLIDFRQSSINGGPTIEAITTETLRGLVCIFELISLCRHKPSYLRAAQLRQNSAPPGLRNILRGVAARRQNRFAFLLQRMRVGFDQPAQPGSGEQPLERCTKDRGLCSLDVHLEKTGGLNPVGKTIRRDHVGAVRNADILWAQFEPAVRVQRIELQVAMQLFHYCGVGFKGNDTLRARL